MQQENKLTTLYQVAQIIDHTLLKANSTPEQITKICEEAKKYHFKSVCVNSSYVKLAHDVIYGKQQKSSSQYNDIKVCAAIGFPLGMMMSQAKAFQAKVACQQGAEQIDVVMNVGQFLAKNYDYVKKDIELVRNQINSVNDSIVLKVILETCYLDDGDDDKEQLIEKASQIAIEAGADFVKTSTGFGSGGATQSAVKRMKKVCMGKDKKVKASGGIGNYSDLCGMVACGADRIGASKGVLIMEEASKLLQS